MTTRRHSPQGMTLLEIIVALAIMAGSAAVLAQLVNLGLRAAAEARELTQAQLLAESLMSEIAAGITYPDDLAGVTLQEDPRWSANTFVQASTLPGILQVTLVLEREEENSSRTRPTTFELTRWIRDPSLAYPEEETTESSSGSSSGAASSTENGADQGSDEDSDAASGGAAMGGGGGRMGGGGRGGGGRGNRGQGGNQGGQGGQNGQGGGRGGRGQGQGNAQGSGRQGGGQRGGQGSGGARGGGNQGGGGARGGGGGGGGGARGGGS